MKPWYKLNLDVSNCFGKNPKLPTPVGQFGIWSPLATKICHPDWLNYLQSLGLTPYSFMVFYRGPWASTADAHIDIATADPWELTHFAINWCIGGSGSEMIWYEMPKTTTQVHYTNAKTPYMAWNTSTLKEIGRHHIGEEVTLVRTDIPHAIKMGPEPRWCFSMRLTTLENVEWDRAVDILKEKNLL